MKVSDVRPVPPEMAALGELLVDGSWAERRGFGGPQACIYDLHEIVLRENDTGCGRREFISDERY